MRLVAAGLGSPVMAAFPRCPYSTSSTAPQNPAWPAGSLWCDLGGWGRPRVANGVSSQLSSQHQAGSGTRSPSAGYSLVSRGESNMNTLECGPWSMCLCFSCSVVTFFAKNRCQDPLNFKFFSSCQWCRVFPFTAAARKRLRYFSQPWCI